MENIEPSILDDLKAIADRGLTSGEFASPERVERETSVFRERFGPEVLRNIDGEALLHLMHGRRDAAQRCLSYWLEFKNDAEFGGRTYGGIGGGSALKFGVFQRERDGEWVGGSSHSMVTLKTENAVAIARDQRDQLLRGHAALAKLTEGDNSDAAYSTLQREMQKGAPSLSELAWAHKYWFLIHPTRLDDFHAPNYQRYQLLRLLQTPPDSEGILNYTAPRFICAGRFVALAKHLACQITTITSALHRRHGAIRHYWRVGTTGGDGQSQWATMRKGGFVSIGWKETLPDLTPILQDEKSARAAIRGLLTQLYVDDPGTATKKSGEVLRFASEMAELDIVLACEGQTVLGVGRVTGSYTYDGTLEFPHLRSVEWLLLEPWQMPENEGLRTTVKEFGKHAANILELEKRLLNATAFGRPEGAGKPQPPSIGPVPGPGTPPPLDPFTSRIDAILRRKSQVIFYGPPGTGKTFRALAVARELSARQIFGSTFSSLDEPRRATIDGHVVQLCTFHPSYGYEDFMEGYRPKAVGGQMHFEPRDGIFKALCALAENTPQHNCWRGYRTASFWG